MRRDARKPSFDGLDESCRGRAKGGLLRGGEELGREDLVKWVCVYRASIVGGLERREGGDDLIWGGGGGVKMGIIRGRIE